jgi:hypothetical protein
MHAQIGDAIRTRARWGRADGQQGRVLETLGRRGMAYPVRWDGGFESIYYPEGDVDIVGERYFARQCRRELMIIGVVGMAITVTLMTPRRRADWFTSRTASTTPSPLPTRTTSTDSPHCSVATKPRPSTNAVSGLPA